MAGAEVKRECAAQPVVAWASGVWGQTACPHTLEAAWKHQQITMATKPAWAKVKGPAGACIMVLKGIGWQWPFWHTMISRTGIRVDMRGICPQGVKAMVLQESEQQHWAEWTAVEGHPSIWHQGH